MNRKKKTDEWIRTFEVKDAIKQKDGHNVYPIVSVVYLKGFPEVATKITVHKRYSEFEKLHRAMEATHKGLYLKGDFPDLPKPSFLRRNDPEVLIERRDKIHKTLDAIAVHRQLFTSPIFTSFFAAGECDTPDSSDTSSELEIDPSRTPTPSKSQLIKLHHSGNLMDASALSSKFLDDKTPTLNPTSTLSPRNLSPNPPGHHSKASTPTTPDEEMKNLPDYLSEAAEDISKAMQLESEENFDDSIECYRNAIGTLLSSVQQDKCLKRQASVKRRIAQYINKAESLIMEKQKKEGLQIKGEAHLVKVPHLDLFGNIKDLKRYKVTNVVSNKILLARDFKSDSIVVIKTIHKSSVVLKSSKKSLLPIGIPHMVKLLCYYETEDSLFLILEYIENGQIYDAINHIFEETSTNSSKLSSPNDNSNNKKITTSSTVIKASPSFIKNRSCPDNYPQDIDFVLQCEESDDILCVNTDGIEKITMSCSSESTTDQFDIIDDEMDEDEENLVFNINESNKKNANILITEIDNLRLDCRSSTPMFSPFRKQKAIPNKQQNESPQQMEINDVKKLAIFENYDFLPKSPLPIDLLKNWAAQLCSVLFLLHSRGVIVMDLNPRNLLLGAEGQLVLTYQWDWVSIDQVPDNFAVQCHYTAPEVSDVEPLTPSCDWWSVGVILYELVTGKYFVESYPSGIRLHAPVEFPCGIDRSLESLISSFLHPIAKDRLGWGTQGQHDIMNHEFFQGIDWSDLM